MRNILLHGFSSAIRQWRVAAIVYLVQFCLALTLGMQVHSVLEASIGQSVEINKLLQHYDHTVLTDFLKVHGASITPLIGQLRWLLLTWLVFSVFINAGLLVCASSPEQTSAANFWKGGAKYFFSFLKLSLFFLLVGVMWTAMIWLPMSAFIEPSYQYFSSEKYTVWIGVFLLAVYLAGLAVLFVWSVLSRLEKIKSGSSWAKNLQNGWKNFWKNKRGFLALLSVFGVLQMAFLGAYWLFEAFIGMTSSLGILVLFVVQQAFVFFKIQIRQMMYAWFAALQK